MKYILQFCSDEASVWFEPGLNSRQCEIAGHNRQRACVLRLETWRNASNGGLNRAKCCEIANSLRAVL